MAHVQQRRVLAACTLGVYDVYERACTLGVYPRATAFIPRESLRRSSGARSFALVRSLAAIRFFTGSQPKFFSPPNILSLDEITLAIRAGFV